MTSFIFHRKNTSPTEYTFVRWIHLNNRKVDLSIGVRLPVLDMYVRTNLLVVTHTNLQFFYSSCSNVHIFHSLENRFRHFVYRKLHVIYIFCVSSSLTAGGRFPGPIYFRFFIAISKRNKWWYCNLKKLKRKKGLLT